MEKAIQNVMKKIDESWEEEVQFTQALVRFPSTQGNEEGVQRYIKNKLVEMGLKVDMFDINISKINKLPGYSPTEWDYSVSPQVVGVLESPQKKGRSLVLNGHVDVVPLGTERYWTRDPWGAEIEGDRMYGRGSTDMKAGVAAMIYAVKAIQQAGIKLAGDVILQAVTDEEGGGNGAVACLERGYRGDGCLVPETFGQKILVGTGGIIWLRTVVPGIPSHPMAGLQRTNAFDNALYLIQGLRKLEEEMNLVRHPSCAHLEHPINFTVGRIAAGDWPAMAPDQCVFTTRVGFYPGTTIEEAKERILEHMAGVVREHPYLKDNPPEFTWTGIHCEGCLIDPETDFLRLLAKVHREITGSEAETMYSPGSADHRFWPLYYGLPATCYGPNGGNPHAHDEYVELPSMLETTKVYARFIMDWCGVL